VSFQVEVADQQDALRLDHDWIERRVQTTLLAEQVHSAEVSIALLDDVAIHALNRDHLGHDYPTDVISFAYDSQSCVGDRPAFADVPRGKGLILDGEVLISTQTAIREAKRWGWTPQEELTLYLVHGLLHLCGYDDLSADEQAVMRERERSILKFWDLTPHYEGVEGSLESPAIHCEKESRH
jgi:probable rRNA maturation factor